jgi:hypothetical protein
MALKYGIETAEHQYIIKMKGQEEVSRRQRFLGLA